MMATGILWQPQPEPPDTVSPGSILQDPAHSRVADLLPMSYTTRGTCTSWTKHTRCLDVTCAEMQHWRLQTRAKGSTKSQACMYALIQNQKQRLFVNMDQLCQNIVRFQDLIITYWKINAWMH